MTEKQTVANVVANYPKWAQKHHADLRRMLFEQAQESSVGRLTETLKWGQPSYLTDETRSGTTIRLAWSEKSPEVFQVLVHCQTSLVEEWRQKFGSALTFDGNRALHLAREEPLPEHELRQCFAAALTYHRR